MYFEWFAQIKTVPVVTRTINLIVNLEYSNTVIEIDLVETGIGPLSGGKKDTISAGTIHSTILLF